MSAEVFDCFLSYNRRDKPAVLALATTLRGRGISVWVDEERLRPGVPWQRLLEAGIRASRSVAVLVGTSGFGPWEEEETRAALSLAVREKRPVIPVLLPDAPAEPDLPLFLHERTWVDMRSEAGPGNLSPLDMLIWGISGMYPDRAAADPSPRNVNPNQAQKSGRKNARRDVIEMDFKPIRDYVRQQEETGIDYLCEAKLLIVGEAGAGKSTLAAKLFDPAYTLDPDQPSTEGIDILRWHFPSRIYPRSGDSAAAGSARARLSGRFRRSGEP